MLDKRSQNVFQSGKKIEVLEFLKENKISQ